MSDLVNDLSKQVADLTAANSELRSALESLVDWCIKFTPEYPACLVRAKSLIAKNS